ncbi:LysR family transcriptional regulator [Vibrio sp. Isolate34]|uniref:LysR family transcriptional regulator n=1 Tax=Vibrio sp. Isolate34 TaxID=2908540 RepID=UPI001EFE2668|nr:LysR family transcriptional regulator [Vibrio sp. Isolate34]MCG9641070.1 LysR family transcriptional regulator [Vibrio sp. Isolate34]
MINDLNYNLLRELSLLYRYRSMKVVANKLGVTESAVSKRLAHLRAHFDDPLFVRVAGALEPTHFLDGIMPGVNQGLELLNQSLRQTQKFVAAEYDETIRIAIHSLTMERYGLEIYNAIRAQFPKPMISIETWSSQTENDILDNRIQIGINFFHEERRKSLYQARLAEIKAVVVVSANSNVNTWEEAIKLPFIFFRIPGWNDEHHRFTDECAKKGIFFDYQAKTDDMAVACQLVNQNGMAVVSLERVVEHSDLKSIKVPSDFAFDIPIITCCRLVNRTNPLHDALINIIKAIVV